MPVEPLPKGGVVDVERLHFSNAEAHWRASMKGEQRPGHCGGPGWIGGATGRPACCPAHGAATGAGYDVAPEQGEAIAERVLRDPAGMARIE